jgi:pre-mRNA-processing factor SLU7
MSSSSAPPTHQTESHADRKKAREMAEARQSGAVAPEVDVKTGAIINPHNPEFITRRPWYLGGDAGAGPSLDHQGDQRAEEDKKELSLGAADRLVREERARVRALRKAGKFRAGMWVEALRRGRRPYLICQITKIRKKGTVFDLAYDDGTVETGVRFGKEERDGPHPRIRMTKTGNRAVEVDKAEHGRTTYDAKRDAYLGYEVDMKRMEEKFATREALRREAKEEEEKEMEGSGGGGGDGNGNEGGTGTTGGERTADTAAAQKARGGDRGSDSDSDYDSDEGGSDSEDEFVQRDEAALYSTRLARQGGVGGAQMKVTARNLRIREDTAKYLRNLDPSSAYYDPKSRSMRDNPNPEAPAEQADFAGDNFSRISGDAVGLAETQLFAWEAERRGAAEGLHPQANPSQAELLKKKIKTRSADLRAEKKRAVLDRYGGAEYLDGVDGLGTGTEAGNADDDKKARAAAAAAEERKVRFGVSIAQEEYTRDGRLVRPGEGGAASSKKMANLKSKYEEDVYVNGHTTVWGSYFHKGAFAWGYADDHSLMRNAYCTGAAGRAANDEANEMRYGTGAAGSAAMAQAREMLKAVPAAERTAAAAAAAAAAKPSGSKMYGEANQHANLDKAKVRSALRKAAEQDESNEEDVRKRKYNSISSDGMDVTEEEMEAFRLRRERSDDPMAKLANNDGLLEYK